LAAAREAGINVQENINGFNDPLPDEFYLTRRFGDARTWGRLSCIESEGSVLLFLKLTIRMVQSDARY